ncbi:hypothetical protein ACFQH3_20315 [Haladaptatus sp. GCM10025707]|uniref:hypothetical protein n=1 Tax=Haladaptatus sp. GCM10025707 TaxID=3252658 RepID=UPI00360F2B8F
MVETWPTIAILPLMNEESLSPSSENAPGVDRAVGRVLEAYLEMGFESRWVPPLDEGGDARAELVRQCYTTTSALDEPEQVVPDIERMASMNRPEEVRGVARSIQADIADGIEPKDIGVVVTNAESYRDITREVFEQYEIPYTSSLDYPVFETRVGDAISTAFQVIDSSAHTDSLVRLLSNPLVSVAGDESERVVAALSNLDQRLDSPRLARAYHHLIEEHQGIVDSLLKELNARCDTSLHELPGELERLLEYLGISTALEDTRGPYSASVEERAHSQILHAARTSRKQLRWSMTTSMAVLKNDLIVRSKQKSSIYPWTVRRIEWSSNPCPKSGFKHSPGCTSLGLPLEASQRIEPDWRLRTRLTRPMRISPVPIHSSVPGTTSRP